MNKVESADSLDVSSGLHAIKFEATWCMPCKKMTPLIDKMKEEFPEVSFHSVDVDEVPDIASKYDIKNLPSLLLLKDGVVQEKVVGVVLVTPLRKIFKELTKES